MITFSFISLLSGLISIFAIVLVFFIFKKVYQEDYKKPWLYIGVATLFFGSSQIIRFLGGFFGIYIVESDISEATTYMLDFIGTTILGYALLLEFLILKYYKGKFVKMKFIPVQEGTLGGDIDLDVESGNSYVTLKKDKNYMIEKFAEATKKGFEGFLITEDNPKEIRTKYNIQKTPIAWITQIDPSIDSRYLKDSLDENSDMLDPLHLNDLINYVDNFLDQAQNPFLLLDLNMILRSNNYTIVMEFLQYVASKVGRFKGVLIGMINVDILKAEQLNELKNIFRELE